MESTQSFYEKAVTPTIYQSNLVKLDSRSKEQQDLIVAGEGGRLQFGFHWALKTTPMGFGLREADVAIGLVELSHEGEVNETVAFDLTEYTVETRFEQRSKGKLSCLICDEVHLIMDENRLLFIFSI